MRWEMRWLWEQHVWLHSSDHRCYRLKWHTFCCMFSEPYDFESNLHAYMHDRRWYRLKLHILWYVFRVVWLWEWHVTIFRWPLMTQIEDTLCCMFSEPYDFENNTHDYTQVTIDDTDWSDTHFVLCFQNCVTLRTVCVATLRWPRTPWIGITPQALHTLVPTLTTPTWHAQVWLPFTFVMFVVVAFYTLARILRECSTVHSLPRLFSFKGR